MAENSLLKASINDYQSQCSKLNKELGATKKSLEFETVAKSKAESESARCKSTEDDIAALIEALARALNERDAYEKSNDDFRTEVQDLYRLMDSDESELRQESVSQRCLISGVEQKNRPSTGELEVPRAKLAELQEEANISKTLLKAGIAARKRAVELAREILAT